MQKLITLAYCLLLSIFHLQAQCDLDLFAVEVDCAGGQNGEIMVEMTGTAPFDISLNGQFIESVDTSLYHFSNLIAGQYLISLADAESCQDSQYVDVNEPALLEADVFVDSSCGYSCIEITPTGGTAPYLYVLNGSINGTQGFFCDFFDPGIYVIQVTDVLGCTFETQTEIIQTPFIEVWMTEEVIDCNSSELSAEVVGGNNIISYAWNTFELTSSIIVDAAGIYSVTVTDTEGCTAEGSYLYDGGFQIESIVKDVDCNGLGSIEVIPIGDFNPTVINWAGPGVSSNELSIAELVPGTYSLLLEDASGCSENYTFEILEFEELSVDFTFSETTCGEANGNIALTVFGGSGGFTYQWDNGLPASASIQNLVVGIYCCTITDTNNCSVDVCVTITEAAGVEYEFEGTPESCLSEGSIKVNIISGPTPVTFNWSTGSTADSITNLVAGTYSVTIVDGNGCAITDTYEIDSPIGLALSSSFTSCNTNDGTATANVQGGASQPTFLWNNGQTSATATGLAPNWYSVTVTDELTDCTVHQNIQVLEDPICYVRIEGYVLLDEIDMNCDTMQAEGIEHIQVELSDGQITYTDQDGFYQFTTDAGEYVINVNYTGASYDGLCIDPIAINADTWGSSYSDNDFYFEYGEDQDVQIKVIKPNARPGFNQKVRICLMNIGAVSMTGTLTFIHPDVEEFVESAPMQDNYDEGTSTLTWEYEDLPPGAIWIYNIYLYTPIGTDLGTPLDYFFQANPIAGDLTPENNTIECSIVVTGSFDPNDKAVTPEGIGENGSITMEDSLLTYKVRFQNTGTDTAFTVRVLDTLDIDLDERTVVPGPASHPYTLTVKDGNVLDFLFENIMLPDSFVNEPASNGFFMFDVKIKEGSPYGTRIENRAGIYFDFNEPIITNTVVNTIEMVNEVSSIAKNDFLFEVFPNPGNGQGNYSIQLDSPEMVSIKAFDINGKIISELSEQKFYSKGSHVINFNKFNLVNGVYFIQAETQSGKVAKVKYVLIK